MSISLGMWTGGSWPDRKRVESETLEDGRVRHTLENGVKIIVNSHPTQELNYLSTWMGAKPGETYEIHISLIGISEADGFFDAWNHDIEEWRCYRFDKTVSVRDLENNSVIFGHELKSFLPPL